MIEYYQISMRYVSGEILTEKGFKDGYIEFQNNNILDIQFKKSPKKPIASGIITPSLINFHTHIGDSFIKNKNLDLPKDIEKLVAPPDGLKYKLLKNSSKKEVINGIKDSINLMLKTGTKTFLDFRENGINGINLLKKSTKKSNINSIILSRPKKLEYTSEEINTILEKSDGIGLSSITDWNFEEIINISKKTHRKNKIFAIHASERIKEDIEKILDLRPKFLVHMNKATKSDLKKVKENNIPIVICPRANHFFGIKPNYKLLKQTNVDILIGTDNCMLNSPNLIEEINFIRSQTNIFSLKELIKMVTITPRKVLNLRPVIPSQNQTADFIVVDKEFKRVLYAPIGSVIKRDDL